MLLPNSKMSESLPIVASIPNQSITGSLATGWINVANFNKFVFIGMVGALTATGTVDCNIQQATSVTGTGAKAITGKAITQITTTGNTLFEINLRDSELDTNNNFNYIQVTITTTTAASIVGGVLIASSRYDDAAGLISSQQSFAISNLALTTNVVTVTATGHTFAINQIVNVALASGAGFGVIPTGNYQVTAISAGTTFSFAFVSANIGSAAATGTAANVNNGVNQIVG